MVKQLAGVTLLLTSLSLVCACNDTADNSTTEVNDNGEAYAIIYDGNANSSGSVPVDTAQYQQSQPVSVLANSSDLIREGYSFAGWNTQADGNGITYWPGAILSMGGDDITLYAKWEPYAYSYNFADPEARLLAIEASGSMTAPEVIYDRVVVDLQSIRSAYPATREIVAQANWDLQALLVGFTEAGADAFSQGSYHAWDDLNTQYALAQTDSSLLADLDAVMLTFYNYYNAPLLAEAYQGLPELRYAEPNLRVGDASDVCLAIHSGDNHYYIFDEASGDCPSGCIDHFYRGFALDPTGSVVGAWDSGVEPAPDWVNTTLELCEDWL